MTQRSHQTPDILQPQTSQSSYLAPLPTNLATVVSSEVSIYCKYCTNVQFYWASSVESLSCVSKVSEQKKVAGSLWLTFKDQIHTMWSIKSFLSPLGSCRGMSIQWKSVLSTVWPSPYSRSIHAQSLSSSRRLALDPLCWHWYEHRHRGLTEANKAHDFTQTLAAGSQKGQ